MGNHTQRNIKGGKELKADILPQNVGLYNPKLRGCHTEDIAALFSAQVTPEVLLCPKESQESPETQ
jgi:hypothetical protein